MTSPSASPKDHYDVVVIGAGPAGLTAGMYAARQGLVTALVAGSIGGQAMWAKHVENFIGWQLVSGPELIERFHEHVHQFDVDCFEGNLVNAIVPDAEGGFEVYSREGLRLSTSTVIIATGKAPNRLSIPGEEQFVGRGVSYCATCDAAFFTGKAVAVIGPGESAADAALELSTLSASSIALISERVLQAPDAVLAKIAADPAITLHERTKPLRVEGDGHVERLVVAGADSAEATLDVSGVFIEIGSIKADDFALGLVEVNERGEIVIDKAGVTSTPGIYAAGDVTDEFGKQIITATGQGARAAMAANRDLKRR
jgi:alkyl hydroperoxide reductase subunit F